MAGDDIPDGIDTELTRNTASATGTVDAPTDAVFDYVRRPANHAAISGDGSVQGDRVGPDALGAVGDRFGMSMKMLGVLPYRITNRVVAYEEGRRIAWAHAMGHTWTWSFEPVDGGRRTKVTETFDLSSAKFPPAIRLMGYPKGHVDNVARSVANVQAHFAA